MLEANLGGERTELSLQRLGAVGVQEHHRNAAETALPELPKCPARRIGVRPLQDLALRVRPRIHFEHLAVQDLGLADLQVEDPGTGLGPDLEQVAKARADHEGARGALALEQRVCGDGRAHPDVARWNRVASCEPQNLPDAIDRSAVGRQDLRDPDLAALGLTPETVGERTTAIDPELPAGACHRGRLAQRSPAITGRRGAPINSRRYSTVTVPLAFGCCWIE